MEDLDRIRATALERIDRADRAYRTAFLSAAVFEGLLLASLLLAADLKDRLHLLIVIATVGSYTMVVLGLFALGAYLGRGNARVLKALELLSPRGGPGEA